MFGADQDFLTALADFGPTLSGEISLDVIAAQLGPWPLYDALVSALCRGRPARADLGRHLVVLTPPAGHRGHEVAVADRRALAGLAGAYKAPLSGNGALDSVVTSPRAFASGWSIGWIAGGACSTRSPGWPIPKRQARKVSHRSAGVPPRPRSMPLVMAAGALGEALQQPVGRARSRSGPASSHRRRRQASAPSAPILPPASTPMFTFYNKTAWCPPADRPSANWKTDEPSDRTRAHLHGFPDSPPSKNRL